MLQKKKKKKIRSDVQAAINAPKMTWNVCQLGVFADNIDQAQPPSFGVLPSVIERLNKTLIVSGQLDLTLPTNGTLQVSRFFFDNVILTCIVQSGWRFKT
jgi:hypothetical protein